MKEQNRSIWGNWWEPFRKWVYPAWLLYEVSIRFYDYAWTAYRYIIKLLSQTAPWLGSIATQVLSITGSLLTFVLCTAFMSVPTCLILYKFFKVNNLTSTRFERRMKVYF